MDDTRLRIIARPPHLPVMLSTAMAPVQPRAPTLKMFRSLRITILALVSRMPLTAQLPSGQPSSQRASLVPRITRPFGPLFLRHQSTDIPMGDSKSLNGSSFSESRVPIIFNPGSLQSGFSRQPHFPARFHSSCLFQPPLCSLCVSPLCSQ